LVEYDMLHRGLYGCLPGSKRNLCCVAKKSAAYLYPALIAWSVWFPRLARWPRCISAGKRLISWNGLFRSLPRYRFSSPRSDLFTSLHSLLPHYPTKTEPYPFDWLVNKYSAVCAQAACGLTL
jgi:hypothetical protein